MKFELSLDPFLLPATPPTPGRPVERTAVALRLDLCDRRADRADDGDGTVGGVDRHRRSLADGPRTAAAWREASRRANGPPGAAPPVVSGAVPVLRTVVPPALAMSAPLAVPAPPASPAPPAAPAMPAPSANGSRWFEATLPRRRTLVVPPGVHLVGDFRAHTVHVEGRVDGRVVATGGPLIVAPGACVTGSVEGRRDVVIAGRVVATDARPAVKARGHLHLACTSHVTGAVSHRGVSVYEGAVVGTRSRAEEHPTSTRSSTEGRAPDRPHARA